jgi:hypothetical protein
MHTDQSVSIVGPSLTPIAPRVSWGAIFGGALVAVGVWLLLHLLGMSIGLIAVDPNDASSLRGVGIGTGVWSLIAPILALFVGGLATGWLTGPLRRMTGAIHGAVMWSLATVTSLALVWTMVAALVGGILSAGTQVASATAGGAMERLGEDEGGGLSLEALGLSADDLLGPLNERLQAAGKPAITAEQLKAAAQDALRTSVRQGQFDREILVNALAENTALSRADVNELAGTIQQQYQQRMDRLGELGQKARQRALEAVEDSGKALLGLFFSMLFGLAAAVGGAMLGAGRDRQRMRTDTRGHMTHGMITPAE